MVRAKPWARVETELDSAAFAFPVPGRLVLLGSDPAAVDFYDALGALPCAPAAWKAPPGMVARVIPATVCATMSTVAAALRD